MHCLAVGQDDDPEVALLSLHEAPQLDTPIRLDTFLLRFPDHALDPGIGNPSPIRALANESKVRGSLHRAAILITPYNAQHQRRRAAPSAACCCWAAPSS